VERIDRNGRGGASATAASSTQEAAVGATNGGSLLAALPVIDLPFETLAAADEQIEVVDFRALDEILQSDKVAAGVAPLEVPLVSSFNCQAGIPLGTAGPM